jgi:nucleoside-diphosphate-sugar epimerase
MGALAETIFVTGGTGFIGWHVLKQARAMGRRVRALRRPGSVHADVRIDGVEWLEREMGEVREEEVAGCGVLVHLAAAGVDPTRATWEGCFQTNVVDSLALWRKAVRSGIRRLIVCGSCFEYGTSGERYEFIPVTAPLEPTGSYGASKAAATMAAVGLIQEAGIEGIILRPFHVFGEGEAAHRFWPSLRSAAEEGKDFPMTAGMQVRDFVPVECVAESFLAACDEPLTVGKPVVRNVGTGRAQTLLDFARYWWKEFGAKGTLRPGAVPYREGEVMRYVPEV